MQGDFTQLAKDMIESDAAFRDQFDRNSENYHGGDSTVVPTDGKNIPISMPTEYLENQEVQPVITDFGPEYQKVSDVRELFNTIKKLLLNLPQYMEANLRNQVDKDKIIQENLKLETDCTQLTESLDKLEDFTQSLNKSEYKDKFLLPARKLTSDGLQNGFKDKESLTDYGMKCKQLSSLMFNETKKLLDEMKKIKKNALTAK